jgi:alkylresorcinol/alkylpyrone synthase
MERVCIADVAVAHPDNHLEQSQAASLIGAASGAARTVAALARGTGIHGRSLALTPAEVARLGGIEERNQIYGRLAPGLAGAAASKALGTWTAETSFLVTSSCTGYLIPGLDVALAGLLGLDCDLARLPITEAGCAGGVVALARAADYLRAHPGATALATAVEICSLAFHPKAEDGNLISTLIFGDGAGAALLRSRTPVAGDLEIVDAGSVLIPGTRDVIGFDLTDAGFCPVLSRELADVLPGPAGGLVSRLLSRYSLAPSDVRAWLLHPGGPRILDRMGQHLGLERSAMRWSWQSLAEFGNTSSAAIFDVLRRFREDESAPREGWGIVLAFGPGVSIEALLIRRPPLNA